MTVFPPKEGLRHSLNEGYMIYAFGQEERIR